MRIFLENLLTSEDFAKDMPNTIKLIHYSNKIQRANQFDKKKSYA